MTAAETKTLIGSVQRALRVVDVVANASRPVTPKLLADRLGLSLGTTCNILRTLVHEGYLAQEPDGVILGAAHPVLAGEAGAGAMLSQVRQTLRSITEELGAASYLSRYEDGEVTIVDVVDTPASPHIDLWVGIDESAHATALGKQILSELTGRERRDYLHRHSLESLTRNTISDRRALLADLERPAPARLDRQEYALGTTCVAVPVRAPGTVASLAISLPSRNDADFEETVARLRLAAGTLSLLYGGALGEGGA